MKKIIIVLILYSFTFAQFEHGKILSLEGNVSLNRKQLKDGEFIDFSSEDTLYVQDQSQVKIEFMNGYRLWVKDRSKLILNDFRFELQLGLLRFQAPYNNDGKEEVIIATEDLVTSVMHGNSYYDFAIKKEQDTTLIAVYQGDSLIVQEYSPGEKSLSRLFYLSKLKTFSWVKNELTAKFDSANSPLNISIWGNNLCYAEYLIDILNIDSAKLVLNSLLYDKEDLNKTELQKIHYYLAYIYSFDGKEQLAINEFKSILAINPNYRIQDNLKSPKIEQIYQKALSGFQLDHQQQQKSKQLFKFTGYSLVPGLYQLKNNQKIKGNTLLIAGLTCIGGFLYSDYQQDYYYDKSLNSSRRKLIDQYYNRSVDHFQNKKLYFYAIIGIYTFNIFDLYHQNQGFNLGFHADKNKINISFCYHF